MPYAQRGSDIALLIAETQSVTIAVVLGLKFDRDVCAVKVSQQLLFYQRNTTLLIYQVQF